jgi:hypothetical protein
MPSKYQSGDWAKLIRPLSRNADGQVTLTMREMCRLEAVLGSNVRSGQQIARGMRLRASRQRRLSAPDLGSADGQD